MPAPPHPDYETFFQELRALVRRLLIMGGRLHGGQALSVGQKSLLAELDAYGPRTIPELTRSRPASRQHIQALVHELTGAGLVAARPNPAHRRSHFLELTPAGRERLTAMRQREQAALAALDLPFRPEEIRALAEGLRRVREGFEAHTAARPAREGDPIKENP